MTKEKESTKKSLAKIRKERIDAAKKRSAERTARRKKIWKEKRKAAKAAKKK